MLQRLSAIAASLTFGRCSLWAVLAMAGGCDSYLSADSLNGTTPMEQPYWVEEVTNGLSYPWAMTWLSHGEMLITERLGTIRVLRDGRLTDEVHGVPAVLDSGLWDGLFAIELDPDFIQNHLVYLTYTDGAPGARIGKVFRARLEGNRLLDGQVIFTSSPALSSIGPIMMRILFLPDKTMLVGIGSGDFNPELVQRLDNHIGKIIRINRDGTVPGDNPFLNTSGARKEIWATGLRNPSGFARMNDGSIWVVDIGPKGGDELNQLAAGSNYGWPLAGWGFDYSGDRMSPKQEDSNFTAPVLVWSPSHTPSDLVQYRGRTFPFWDRDLFTGGLSGLSVRRMRVREGQVVLQERMLAHLNERIRSVQVGPDNLIYLLTDSGRLLRLRPGMLAKSDQTHVAKPSTESSDLQFVLKRDRIERRARLADAASKYEYDPSEGKRHFAQHCSGCHRFGEFKVGQIGPDLNAIGNRHSGKVSGFDYSPALMDPKTRIVWKKDTLLNFLADPQSYFPGTRMASPPIMDPLILSSIVNFILNEDSQVPEEPDGPRH